MRANSIQTLLITSTAFLLVVSPNLVAQEQGTEIDEPGEPTFAEQFAAETGRITAAVAELNRLRQSLPDMEPGFRELMQRRIDDKEAQVSQAVNSLAALTIEQQESGQPYHDQLRAWLELLLPWLDDRLVRSSAAITGGIGDLSGMPTPEAASIAIEVSALISEAVSGFAAYELMLGNLEALGSNVADRRAALLLRVQDGAEMLAVAIEIDTEDLSKLRYRLTLTPADADLLTMIKIVDLRRIGYARDLRDLSGLLENLGLDASQYRSLVLVVTGDATEFLDAGVLATLASQWSESALEWINDNGLGIVLKALLFLAIFFIFRGLSRLTRRWVARGVNKVNLSFLLRNMIIATAGNVVLALGVMIALSQVGVSLGPLLAGLGVAGFIVGFALQDTLANFASGMMILIYRPYDVGDIITAGGITGQVEDMSLVYTVVLTFDNQKMIVPNSKIWGDVIQNVTSQRIRRVDLVFGIAYSDDIDKAEAVLADIVAANEMTLDDPEPMIKLHTLNESSVDFVVRPWTKSADYWDVYWDITRAVKKRFDEEGISIPFPQRDVHHFYDEAPPTPV